MKTPACPDKALKKPIHVTDWATGGLSVLGALNRLDIAGDVLSDADIVVGYCSPEEIYPGMSAL